MGNMKKYDQRKMDVSKSSISVFGGSFSKSSFLILFQDLSQNSICSRLMKLSLPMDRRRQMALILFSCMLRAFLRQSRISAKVITFSLWISQTLLLSPFFLIRRMIFLIWCLLSLGKASCFFSSRDWMNQTSLLKSKTTKQTISSLTPYSMGMPLQRFKPTVEMYLRGSMVEGQMKLRKPTKSTLSLYPQSPKRIFTSSSDFEMRFSSSICRTCLRVMSPSPLEMQLKRARGWKSERVVMASRQACRTFSCCSSSAKQLQMLLKISPYFSSARLPTLYRFITNILQSFMERGYMRTIIINADDYGCNASIDRGIAALLRKGCINSTSAIVNGADIQQAAHMVRQMREEVPGFQRNVSVGLHFNLTEGKPLTSSILSSKLVQNGEFVGKPKIFTIASEPDAFDPLHVSQELTAQVERFIDFFGRKPSHIDGHNHVHIIPSFAAIIASTMKRLGICKTRIPLQKLQTIAIPLNHDFLKFTIASQQIYKNNGIISVRQFVGLETFGKLSPQLLRRAVKRQQGSETVSAEMMCHPGFPAEEGNAWIRSQDRLAEMQQLENQFGQFRGHGNYYDLCDEVTSELRMLICYPMEKQQGEGFKEQEEILQKCRVPIYYWTKVQQKITERINRLDFELFIKALKITHIVDLSPSLSSAYIGQIAQLNNIPFLPINQQSQILEKITEFLPKYAPQQESGNKNQ